MKFVIPLLLLVASIAHADETQRLVTHFDTVIAELQSADVHTLTPTARAARLEMIATLGAYRDARRFPRNTRFVEPTPFFIDDDGTRCAMAHLIETSGHGDFVKAVAATRNTAYIDDLASEATLLRWLDAHGLTVAEAARIQPGYACVSAAECHCSLVWPAEFETAIYEATVSNADRAAPTVRIEAIRGRAGNATLSVGDIVPAYEHGYRATDEVLLGTFGRQEIFFTTHVIEDDEARCVSRVGGALTSESLNPPNVSTDALLAAAAAPNCQAALVAHDPVLANPRCGSGDDDDCSQRPGDDTPPWLALFVLAICGARARRAA